MRSDVHAPASLRATVPIRNMDEFHDAFDIELGDAMYLPPDERIVVWQAWPPGPVGRAPTPENRSGRELELPERTTVTPWSSPDVFQEDHVRAGGGQPAGVRFQPNSFLRGDPFRAQANRDGQSEPGHIAGTSAPPSTRHFLPTPA